MEEITEKYSTHSEDETQDLGSQFAKKLKSDSIVALYGGLGAGKTQFIKGVCSKLKVNEVVTSPTFTVINQYSGKREGQETTIYHIDLYRIKSSKELEGIGFEECLYEKKAIKLVEWPEKAETILPDNTIKIHFSTSLEIEDDREITIEYPEDYFEKENS